MVSSYAVHILNIFSSFWILCFFFFVLLLLFNLLNRFDLFFRLLGMLVGCLVTMQKKNKTRISTNMSKDVLNFKKTKDNDKQEMKGILVVDRWVNGSRRESRKKI